MDNYHKHLFVYKKTSIKQNHIKEGNEYSGKSKIKKQ